MYVSFSLRVAKKKKHDPATNDLGTRRLFEGEKTRCSPVKSKPNWLVHKG